MESTTQDPLQRPLRENYPEELGDFQRLFEIFEVKFSVVTPLKGCDPLI